MLVGATAYRMLAGWHAAQRARRRRRAGLGRLRRPRLAWRIQIAKALGGIPIAVVSSDERGEYCKKLGAKGYINRKKFDHWGRLPDWHGRRDA